MGVYKYCCLIYRRIKRKTRAILIPHFSLQSNYFRYQRDISHRTLQVTTFSTILSLHSMWKFFSPIINSVAFPAIKFWISHVVRNILRIPHQLDLIKNYGRKRIRMQRYRRFPDAACRKINIDAGASIFEGDWRE